MLDRKWVDLPSCGFLSVRSCYQQYYTLSPATEWQVAGLSLQPSSTCPSLPTSPSRHVCLLSPNSCPICLLSPNSCPICGPYYYRIPRHPLGTLLVTHAHFFPQTLPQRFFFQLSHMQICQTWLAGETGLVFVVADFFLS